MQLNLTIIVCFDLREMFLLNLPMNGLRRNDDGYEIQMPVSKY